MKLIIQKIFFRISVFKTIINVKTKKMIYNSNFMTTKISKQSFKRANGHGQTRTKFQKISLIINWDIVTFKNKYTLTTGTDRQFAFRQSTNADCFCQFWKPCQHLLCSIARSIWTSEAFEQFNKINVSKWIGLDRIVVIAQISQIEWINF